MAKYYEESEGGDLRAALDREITGWPGVVARTSFGCPSYWVDEAPFVVVVSDGLLLTRLAPSLRREVFETFDADVFRPDGRTVGSWVHVRVDPGELNDVLPYVELSYEAARQTAV